MTVTAPTTSRWRLQARRAIALALAALPAGATRKDAERAIRGAYPFGAREHHPYRTFCLERRLALADRFGAAAATAPEPTPPALYYEIQDYRDGGPLRLVDCCEWCGRNVEEDGRGCAYCFSRRRRLEEALEGPLACEDFRRLLLAAAGDRGAVPLALDMAEECLGERPLPPPAAGEGR